MKMYTSYGYLSRYYANAFLGKKIAAGIQVTNSKLNKYHIKHAFEIYKGAHLKRIAKRIGKNIFSAENSKIK